jgi:hypothetical protein
MKAQKQIYFLQPQVLDKFTVFEAEEPQEPCIVFVRRFRTLGIRTYRFTEALKDLIEYNYFEN